MATKARPAIRFTNERLFYSGMALLIFASVVIGFAPTWFMRGSLETSRPLNPLSPLVVLHGTLFTTWIALFVTQAGLISARQHKLHMRLGIATVVLGAVMVVVGTMTAVGSVAREVKTLGPMAPLAITTPFFDVLTFGGLLAGGFAYRRQPQVHKRLMLCATAVMLQPGIARMEFVPMVLGDETLTIVAFLAATPLLAWDFVQRGRPHPATLIGLGVLAGDELLQLAVLYNKTWLGIAGWIVKALS